MEPVGLTLTLRPNVPSTTIEEDEQRVAKATWQKGRSNERPLILQGENAPLDLRRSRATGLLMSFVFCFALFHQVMVLA